MLFDLIKLYINLIPTILTSTLNYFITGPQIKNWNFLTYLFVKILNKVLTLPYSNIQNWRELLDWLGSTKCKSSKNEFIVIHSKFRQKAYNLVNEHLLKVYGEGNWYEESCKPENSSPLKAEWIIPNSMTITASSKVILFFHSGAFSFGNFSKYRAYMEEIGQKTGTLVLGVNYRLAPEYSAPCQLEDALASLLYLIEPSNKNNNINESGIGLNLNQIILMGDSAGGGLCSSLYHFLRDVNFGKPSGSVLFSPWLDLSSTTNYSSYGECINTDFLPPPLNLINEGGNSKEILDGQLKLIYNGSSPDIKSKILKRGHYLAPIKFLNSTIISPLKDTNFLDLPPILIITGDAEVLRDESIYYNDLISSCYSDEQIENLRISPIELNLYPEMMHIFPMNFPFLGESKEATLKTIKFINKCFEVNN